MDFDVPTDLINQSQIGFREGAGLSSFNPKDTTLPSPPTLKASITTLDPSPSHLRCKSCQGKLLRGLQSLICIYCGEYQKKDVHPDPISFNSTNGYSWLLKSLNFNGSERVGSFAEGSGIHGGQSPAEDLVTLSELLDLQISWRDQPNKPENIFNNKHTSPLNLGTANLDNFFTDRIESEEQASSKQDENKAFKTSVSSSIDVNDDASSDWNAEFQFADSKVEDENPKPVDPFIAPEADLSAHMDAVFGQMEGLNNKKPNEDKEDDLFTNMGPTTFQPKDGFSGQSNDPSSKDVDQDWFSDDNWQKSSAKKDEDSHNKPNDSSTEGVSEDLFENATWQKSSGKKDDFKPHTDAASSPSGQLNDPSSKDADQDWFNDDNWQKSSAVKDKDSHNKLNDSSNEGVSEDLFKNATWQKSSGKKDDFISQTDAVSSPSGQLNDPSSKDADQDWFSDDNWQKSSADKDQDSHNKPNDSFKDDNLFDFKPQIDAVSSPSGQSNDPSSKDFDQDWFNDNNWQRSSADKAKDSHRKSNDSSKDDDLFDFKPQHDAVSSSPSLVNDLNVDSQISSNIERSDSDSLKKQDSNATNKDDDGFDEWNDFTSSTVNQDSWKQSSNENTAASEKIPELDFFSESSTSNRNMNAEGGNNTLNASTSLDNDVQMLMSQMHDLSFMLKSELSIPSKKDDLGPSHS